MRTIKQILSASFETVTAEEWERLKVHFSPTARRASAPLPEIERKGKGKPRQVEDTLLKLLDD